MMMSMVVAFTDHALARLPGPAQAALPPPAGEEQADLDRGDAPLPLLRARCSRPFSTTAGAPGRLLGGVTLLFVAAAGLALLRAVPLKMLPFDNKNEFQIVVDLPEGTTLERTDAIARSWPRCCGARPRCGTSRSTAGIASPMDFNGMVRHYFLRQGPNVADIRVNLAAKRSSEMQSHEIALRLRDALEAVARGAGARIAIVETPPGPPVLATITAEVYGEPQLPYARCGAGRARWSGGWHSSPASRTSTRPSRTTPSAGSSSPIRRRPRSPV